MFFATMSHFIKILNVIIRSKEKKSRTVTAQSKA
jgi:hypothetical protein